MRKIISIITLLLGLIMSTINVEAKESPSRLTTIGYERGILNDFRVDALDPEWVDGDFINKFLDFYPRSKLRGHGHEIKRLADKYGINIVAYIGQIGKETTFGSVSCGGAPYNFGCYMYANWMGPMDTVYTDRKWADPDTVSLGIEIQMKLLRDGYINTGYVYYPIYLERYSPSFENDHSSFESLMYGVAKSFGQDVKEKRNKVPGGMSTQVKYNIEPVEIEQHTKRQEIEFNHDSEDIEKIELSNWIDTSELGKQTVGVVVFFKDRTIKTDTVDVNIIPKKRTIKVTNLNTGKTIEEKVENEKQLDVTELVEEKSNVGVLNSGVKAFQYKVKEKNGLVEIDEPLKEKKGKFLLDVTQGNTYYIGEEIKGIDEEVDEWILKHQYKHF